MNIEPAKITKILLFCSIVILLSLTFSSLMFGKPNQLTRGFDPDGIACGADFESREYPYIYFSNPTKDTLHQTVCIKKCPQPDHKKQMPQQLECVLNSVVKECKQKISVDKPETQFLIYDSFPYKGNICMPRNLAFYETIKELASPPTRLSDTIDVFQNRWILLLFIIISLTSSYYLLDYLKVNTQYCVWGLVIGLFLLVGSLGIVFIMQAKEAFKYSAQTNSISVFQVDEQYILKMTNVPNPYLLILLCLIFVILTFYGGYFLYNNYDRIKDLAELFEQVEKFMIDHNYLQEFSYPLIGLFSFFLFLTIYTILSLRSCFNIDFDQIGPFQKVQGGILYYFQYLVIFLFFWGIQILFGLNNFITAASLVQWIQTGNTINQQQAQLYNHKQSSLILTRYFLEESLYEIGKISHAAFLLLLSPLKFICDTIRDWVLTQKNEKFKSFLTKFLCFPCIYFYEKTRSIEDVLYYELSINKKQDVSINVCLSLVDKYLELKNEETGTIETFEKLRNIVDSFLLITKIFVGLLCAVICKVIMSISYFSDSMYSTNLTCLVAAIIGYYIASIYFQIYAIVTQGLGYIYFRTRFISRSNHDSEIQRTDKKTIFEKFQEAYSELSQIMNRLEEKAQKKNEIN